MSKAGVSKRSSNSEAVEVIVEVKRRQCKRVELTKIIIDGVDVDAKECTKCGEVTPLTSFQKSHNGVGGRRGACKTCTNIPVELRKQQHKLSPIVRVIKGVPTDCRTCGKCKVTKPFSEFTKDKHKSLGVRTVCRRCETKTGKRMVKNIPFTKEISGELFIFKKCSKCKKTLPISEYYLDKYCSYGYRFCCKTCCAITQQKRSAKEGRSPLLNKEILKVVINGKEEQAKICTSCSEVKSLESFINHRLGKGGKSAECKVCLTARARDYESNNRERLKARHLKWSRENRDWIRAKGLKRAAKKKSLVSSCDRLDVVDIMRNCALTGKDDNVQIDHFIAINTGHGGSYVENFIPLSSSLNASKNSHNPFEWIRTRPDIDANRFDAAVAYLADLNGLTLGEYRQFVDWCYANPRTIDEIKRDNERYGYVVSSLELWREATGAAFPIRIDFRNPNEKEASAC